MNNSRQLHPRAVDVLLTLRLGQLVASDCRHRVPKVHMLLLMPVQFLRAELKVHMKIILCGKLSPPCKSLRLLYGNMVRLTQHELAKAAE